jgi:serine protease inhibitor
LNEFMKSKLFLGLALVLSGGVIGSSSIAHAGEPSPGTRKVVAGNTGFAVDLYGKLRTREGNVFFSPYSISTTLAMTCGGARGETEKQMAQTLRLDLPADKLPPAFAALAADLAAVQQKGQVKLAVANSLWPQKGFAFLPDYLACARNTTVHPSSRLITADTPKPRAKRSMTGSRPGPTGKLSSC